MWMVTPASGFRVRFTLFWRNEHFYWSELHLQWCVHVTLCSCCEGMRRGFRVHAVLGSSLTLVIIQPWECFWTQSLIFLNTKVKLYLICKRTLKREWDELVECFCSGNLSLLPTLLHEGQVCDSNDGSGELQWSYKSFHGIDILQ